MMSSRQWIGFNRKSFLFLICGMMITLGSSATHCRADLVFDYSGVAGDTWAINPNNVIGVRFYQSTSAFKVEGVNIFIGTSSSSAITADFSIVEFDSLTDDTGTVIRTLNNVTVDSQFPTDFGTDSTFVDFTALNLTLNWGRYYGIVAHNPSSGLLIGAIDNTDPVDDARAITNGSFPSPMGGAVGQDMAFQMHGTTAIPEPHEVALLAVWLGVLGYIGKRWYAKRMKAATQKAPVEK